MKNINANSAKQRIISALIVLMSEKSYLDITITDVIRKADVARASFYRNFSCISDVIDAITDNISNEFIDGIFPILNGNDRKKMYEFLLEYFHRFVKIHSNMVKMQPLNVSVLFSRMDRMLYEKESKLHSESMKDKYTATGKLGLISNITKKWVGTGMNESPDEMVEYVMTFIMLF